MTSTNIVDVQDPTALEYCILFSRFRILWFFGGYWFIWVFNSVFIWGDCLGNSPLGFDVVPTGQGEVRCPFHAATFVSYVAF